MNNIKVAHEAPLNLLNFVQSLTNSDYCLPHLMDKYDIYKDFFIKAKEKDRYIFLDNSLHELGTPYSEDRLFHWLEVLQPDCFFVPDYWEDITQSIVSAKKWIQYKDNFPNTQFTAVVQAKSMGEAMHCYQIYRDLGYEKIAFSYGASYYNEICPHPNKDFGKALGRLQVISTLRKENIINDFHSIHLLGCSIPNEFFWYKDMPFIDSIDTSNPIMSALEGKSYEPFGLIEKPKLKIDEVMEREIEEGELTIVKWNIHKFKFINNLYK